MLWICFWDLSYIIYNVCICLNYTPPFAAKHLGLHCLCHMDLPMNIQTQSKLSVICEGQQSFLWTIKDADNAHHLVYVSHFKQIWQRLNNAWTKMDELTGPHQAIPTQWWTCADYREKKLQQIDVPVATSACKVMCSYSSVTRRELQQSMQMCAHTNWDAITALHLLVSSPSLSLISLPPLCLPLPSVMLMFPGMASRGCQLASRPAVENILRWLVLFA